MARPIIINSAKVPRKYGKDCIAANRRSLHARQTVSRAEAAMLESEAVLEKSYEVVEGK